MGRALLAILVVAAAGLGGAWVFRKEAILFLVGAAAKEDVAAYRRIDWDRGPQAAPEGERPPNIVFILADDLGINDISTFGGGVADGRVPTPNIDRLAREGAVFSTAYSGAGTCAPSRAMLMTGRYPTRTGFEFTPTPDGMGRVVAMYANAFDRGALPDLRYDAERARSGPPYQDQGLPGSEVTVAESLKDAGYHTIHIGKWHLGRGAEFGANNQGFEESLLMASGLFLPEDDPGVVNAKLPFDPIDKFLWARMQYAAQFNDGEWFEPGGYLTDYWTDEAVKAIEANRNRPFFLYLAHWGVHTPLQATREDYDAVGDIEPHRLRVYAAMVRALDRSVGRVMEKLEEEGLAENTLVVFSSDNGGAGYIGIPEVNEPYRGWKITLFEGGIRVPMFMRWPARIPAGSQIEAPVAHIDVMPTLLEAAGAPSPAGVEIDGRSLLAAAAGEGAVERPGDALFWSSGTLRVVRQADWKLQIDPLQDKVWLFDLAADPTERENLADARPQKRDALLALVEAHWRDARPPLYPHTLESPILIDKTQAEKAVPGDEYAWWLN